MADRSGVSCENNQAALSPFYLWNGTPAYFAQAPKEPPDDRSESHDDSQQMTA